MQVFFFLSLHILSIPADIDRREGATNNFNVINHGRMDSFNVIMFLEKISLHECANYCIMHLQCHSVSYRSTEQLCELNDMEFDEFEADTNAIGWMNYGTPPKVNGGFSDWTNTTGCSRTCGHGHVTYIRSCDNPKPQQGGASCVGDTRKTEPCHTQICPVCYGARTNEYGNFTVRKNGSTKAIKLTHVSGGLKCAIGDKYPESNWGCTWLTVESNNTVAFTTFITDGNKEVLFPLPAKTFFKLKGKTIFDDEITLTRSSAIKVVEGQTLRVYYGEPLFGVNSKDNSGKHCVYVDIIYE